MDARIEGCPCQHATRAEAYAPSEAIRMHGHPGHLRWPDYRSSDRPHYVRVVHHKTGVEVWHPLGDRDGPIYPELETQLGALPRLAVPIVLTPGEKGCRQAILVFLRQTHRSRSPTVSRLARACHDDGMPPRWHDGTGRRRADRAGSDEPIGPSIARRRPRLRQEDRPQRLSASRKRRAWVQDLEHARNESQNVHQNPESERRR
jgi:hypothetical protein